MDEENGLVHTVKATSANKHEVTVMSELLHGEEERVYGDSGYIGANKRQEAIKKNKNGKKTKYIMGIATHASFYLNAPTIGVAKTYYMVDKSLDYIEPDTCTGSYTDIVFNNEVYGRVLRTHDNVRPVFVSAGNYISLDTAVRFTIDMVDEESRLPIPTRLADLETHKMRAALRGK